MDRDGTASAFNCVLGNQFVRAATQMLRDQI
jgi:hypothetical protein